MIIYLQHFLRERLWLEVADNSRCDSCDFDDGEVDMDLQRGDQESFDVPCQTVVCDMNKNNPKRKL